MAKQQDDKGKSPTVALIAAAGVVLAAMIAIIPALMNNGDVEDDVSGPQPSEAAQPIDISGNVKSSAIVTGNDANVTINDQSELTELIDRTAEQSEHPVVELDRPIENQVQLFAEDKVTIVGNSDSVLEVWFGNKWEPFEPNKTYTVWGTKGEPLTPKFKGRGMLKLEVRYTRYRDKARDLRPVVDDDGAPIAVPAA